MSDPAKSIELEDVLSSIRRIVTDDTEPRDRDPVPSSTDLPDRFLLTPALRVPDEKTIPAEPGPLSLEAFRSEPDGVGTSNAGSDALTPPGHAQAGPVSTETSSAQNSATGTMADDRPAVSAEGQGVTDSSLSVEPSGPGPDASDSDVHAGRGKAPRSADGDPSLDGSNSATGIEPEHAHDPAQIDPEVLRDLVAEAVRQELQGVLGERITRNVRKLVRREINRALTMKDLD